jgi:hypothetical protein
VGVAASTYSSIFTAAPLLVVLKEREPKMTEIRHRVRRRETARPVLAPVPDEETIEERELAPAVTPTTARRPQQARRKPKKKPRSKRKRR